MKCPCCNSENTRVFTAQISKCRECEAVFGKCYLGDSYLFVKPRMAANPVPAANLRYFDFDCLGSVGMSRRHGWYDPATGLIHQIG